MQRWYFLSEWPLTFETHIKHWNISAHLQRPLGEEKHRGGDGDQPMDHQRQEQPCAWRNPSVSRKTLIMISICGDLSAFSCHFPPPVVHKVDYILLVVCCSDNHHLTLLLPPPPSLAPQGVPEWPPDDKNPSVSRRLRGCIKNLQSWFLAQKRKPGQERDGKVHPETHPEAECGLLPKPRLLGIEKQFKNIQLCSSTSKMRRNVTKHIHLTFKTLNGITTKKYVCPSQ